MGHWTMADLELQRVDEALFRIPSIEDAIPLLEVRELCIAIILTEIQQDARPHRILLLQDALRRGETVRAKIGALRSQLASDRDLLGVLALSGACQTPALSTEG